MHSCNPMTQMRSDGDASACVPLRRCLVPFELGRAISVHDLSSPRRFLSSSSNPRTFSSRGTLSCGDASRAGCGRRGLPVPEQRGLAVHRPLLGAQLYRTPSRSYLDGCHREQRENGEPDFQKKWYQSAGVVLASVPAGAGGRRRRLLRSFRRDALSPRESHERLPVFAFRLCFVISSLWALPI